MQLPVIGCSGRRGALRLALTVLSLAAVVVAARADVALDGLRGSFDVAAAPVPSLPTAPPAPAAVALLPLPFGLPALPLRSLLVAVHLVGFAIGLGGVTMLDVWILRWMRGRPVTAEIVRTFQFVSKAITAGLALLWASGLGFLALYACAMPECLDNPKLWAKIVIVATLTLNGLIIHRHMLPALVSNVGGPLFADYPAARRSLLLAAGALSGVSWYAAFALGTFKEMNRVVAMETLIGLWLAAVGAAWIVAEIGWRIYAARRGAATDRHQPRTASASAGRSTARPPWKASQASA